MVLREDETHSRVDGSTNRTNGTVTSPGRVWGHCHGQGTKDTSVPYPSK